MSKAMNEFSFSMMSFSQDLQGCETVIEWIR